MAQSVVRKASIVAMLGWIMPEPLAMPPMEHSTPSTSNSTANCLSSVSVVMMAFAASTLPSGDSASTRLCMPSEIGWSESGWPITPVEATATSSSRMPV